MTQIDELIIRVPDGGEENNHLLGSEVAQRVADALPEGLNKKEIAELNIRLTAPVGMSAATMADAIAKQIVQQIRQLNF